MQEETWKNHPKYDFLRFSTLGNIEASDGQGWERTDPIDQSRGYKRFCCQRNKVLCDDLLHRLVLETFYGPPPNDSWQGDHINGDKTDNRLWNLRWIPQDENIRHTQKYGRGGGRKSSDIDQGLVARALWLCYWTISSASKIANALDIQPTQVNRAVRGGYGWVKPLRPDSVPFERWHNYGSDWLPLPEYPNYEISDQGYARSWYDGNPTLIAVSSAGQVHLQGEQERWSPTVSTLKNRYDELAPHMRGRA